jgi:hypothetical protein
MAVVLDHGAAARRGGEDGVERTFAERARPGIDIPPCSFMRLVLAAELMLEGAAAGLLGRHDHLDAMPLEQPDGGLVDRGLEHVLHAAEQQRHALDRRARRADQRLALRRFHGR